MPNYTYTCDVGHMVQIFHPMAAPIRSTCEDPSGCKAAARIKIQPPVFRFSAAMQGDGHEYRHDLARWPGDKRALVDGPRSVRRLVDQTKREVELTGGFVGEAPKVELPRDVPFEQAYDQALNDLEEDS